MRPSLLYYHIVWKSWWSLINYWILKCGLTYYYIKSYDSNLYNNHITDPETCYDTSCTVWFGRLFERYGSHCEQYGSFCERYSSILALNGTVRFGGVVARFRVCICVFHTALYDTISTNTLLYNTILDPMILNNFVPNYIL